MYAPEEQIKRLKSTASGRAKLARANKKKRAATKAGKQHARHGLHSKGKRRRTRKFVGGRVGFAEGGDKDFEKASQTIKDQIISKEELKKIREENKLVGEDGTIYPDRKSKRSEAAYLEAGGLPGKYPNATGMEDETVLAKNRMRYGKTKGNNERKIRKFTRVNKRKRVAEKKTLMLNYYILMKLQDLVILTTQQGYNEYRFFTEEELLKDRELRHFFESLTGRRNPENIFNERIPDPRGKTAFERSVETLGK